MHILINVKNIIALGLETRTLSNSVRPSLLTVRLTDRFRLVLKMVVTFWYSKDTHLYFNLKRYCLGSGTLMQILCSCMTLSSEQNESLAPELNLSESLHRIVCSPFPQLAQPRNFSHDYVKQITHWGYSSEMILKESNL